MEGQLTKNFLTVAGLIVTGLLVGGGLVFAGYKLTQQKVPELEEFTVPVITSSPEPAAIPVSSPSAAPGSAPKTENPLEDWETYTNADYGYQFQHPAGWVFSIDVVNEDLGTALYVIRQGIQSNDIDDYLMAVRTWDNPDELSLADWLQFMRESDALPLPVEDMELTPNTSVGGPASPAGGEEALQFWSDPLSRGAEPGECHQACPVFSVYFVHGNRAYVAQLNYLREFDEDSFVLFSQILSTFEFP